jgi:hypothetical protein
MPMTLDGSNGVSWPGTNSYGNKILQYKTFAYTGGVMTTSNTGTPTATNGATIFSVGFTPLSANSTIVVQTSSISCHEESNAANIPWVSAWYGSTLIGVASGTVNYTSFNGALQGCYHSLNFSVPSWGLTAQTIRIAGGMDGGTTYVCGNSYSNYSGANNTVGLTVFELQ